MKKITTIALVMFPCIAWAQNGPFVVKAKVESASVSTVAHLRYALDGKVTIDSARMVNGLYTFHGEIPYPVGATFWVNRTTFAYANGHMPDVLAFYLEKGEVDIKAKDSVIYATVTGTKINRDYSSYLAFMAASVKALTAANAESLVMMREKKDDPQAQSNFKASYKLLVDNYKAQLTRYIKENPDSFASAEAVSILAGSNMDVAKVEPIYQGLSATVRDSKAGKDLLKRIELTRATSLGAMAPNFTQNDTNGNPVRLSDFRGKYVLLDFWASWCGPCRAENPNYVKAYHQYKDKNFTLLGVSLDRPDAKKAWLAAIKADGLEWTQVSDLQYWYNDVAKQYGIRAIPQNFLIDPSGKIIGINLRGDELQKKLAQTLVN